MCMIDNEKETYYNLDNISLMEEYYDALYEAFSTKGSFVDFNDREREMLACYDKLVE